MSLARFSVNQRVLINLVFLVLLVGGGFALAALPVEAYPNLSFAQAEITTVWYGAGPENVERHVTRKIEDAIEDVRGIDRLTSWSQQDVSIVQVKWRENLSDQAYEDALADLRDKIDAITDLPQGSDPPVVTEITVDEVFATIQVVVVDEGGVGESVLQEAAMIVRDALKDVPGVGSVNKLSLRDREFHVNLDKRALDRYGLTPATVARRIQATSLDLPAGTLPGESTARPLGGIAPQPTGRQDDPGSGATSPHDVLPITGEVMLTASGRYTTIDELAATVVGAAPNGKPLLLSDIGEVSRAFSREVVRTRFNGRPALLLGVGKSAGENALDVVAAVKIQLDELFENGRVPDGVGHDATIDSTQIIRSRLSILLTNLGLGLVLVAVVLWLFLGVRNALLAIIGIPFAFLCTMVVLEAMGMSINALSLFSLVLVSGLVVDDAIVVVENIYRHVETGETLRRAVIEGAREVQWPVITSVLTTIGAFLPLLMAEGSTGEFFKIIPKTVTIALIASLFECLIILPAHYFEWGKRLKRPRLDLDAASVTPSAHAQAHPPHRSAWLVAMVEGYKRLLARALQLRYLVVAVLAAAGIFFLVVTQRLGLDLFPSDFQICTVSVWMPTGATMDETDHASAVIEDILADMPDDLVKAHVLAIGYTWDAETQEITTKSSVSQFTIEFADSRRVTEDPDAVVRELRRRIQAAWDEGRFAAVGLTEMPRVDPLTDGPPMGKPVAVRIQTSDLDLAARIATEVEAKLRAIPGVTDVANNLERGADELRVVLREPQASHRGITFAEVAIALAAANDGMYAVTVTDPDFDTDAEIRVRLRPEDRGTLADLLDLTLMAPMTGQAIKLREVAEVDVRAGFERLYHYDATRTVLVTANVDEQLVTSAEVNERLASQFGGNGATPPGVKLTFGGEYEETQRTFQSMFRALLVAMLVIYALLATQFRSYSQPLAIMVTIPLGYIGVVFALWMSGLPVTMPTMIALVGLAGVIVNDSIVLVTFVNNARRKDGLPLIDAVIRGASTRLRPVILTTATTVLGLVPMAFGFTGFSKLWSPFAMAIMAGMLFATVLTLVMLPCAYVINEEAQAFLRRLFRRPPPEPAEEDDDE